MTTAHFRSEQDSITRLDIFTGMPFDEFRAALEKAAPPFDAAPVARIIADGGDWDDIRAAMRINAPNELIVYAMIDGTSLMAVAGHHTKAIEYLLGNHIIAESMFRYDPHALLYAPLRILLYADAEDQAVFSLQQPSTVFGSLGIPEVTAVGEGLDRKVDALLRVIGVDPGDAFSAHQ